MTYKNMNGQKFGDMFEYVCIGLCTLAAMVALAVIIVVLTA